MKKKKLAKKIKELEKQLKNSHSKGLSKNFFSEDWLNELNRYYEDVKSGKIKECYTDSVG